MGALGAATTLGARWFDLAAAGAQPADVPPVDPEFPLGVAAGDRREDGSVIWTAVPTPHGRRRGPGRVGGRPRPVLPAHRVRRARAGHGRRGLHGARHRCGTCVPTVGTTTGSTRPRAPAGSGGCARRRGRGGTTTGCGSPSRPASRSTTARTWRTRRWPVRTSTSGSTTATTSTSTTRRRSRSTTTGACTGGSRPTRCSSTSTPPTRWWRCGTTASSPTAWTGPSTPAAVRRGRTGVVRAPADAQQAARPHPHAPGDRVGRPGHVPAARHTPVPRRRRPRGARPRRPAVHDGRHPHARGRADPRPRGARASAPSRSAGS